MIAYVTSIGEPTTNLCIWALERNGFTVELLKDDTSLAAKLARIYNQADSDFLRVDADIVVNRQLTAEFLTGLTKRDPKTKTWWWQFLTFDWYKLDTNHSMAFIRQQALPALRANAPRFINDNRPETELSRIAEFYRPRRMSTYKQQLMGLHGYGTKDLKPVIKLKASRGQLHLYDFELTDRLNSL